MSYRQSSGEWDDDDRQRRSYSSSSHGESKADRGSFQSGGYRDDARRGGGYHDGRGGGSYHEGRGGGGHYEGRGGGSYHEGRGGGRGGYGGGRGGGGRGGRGGGGRGIVWGRLTQDHPNQIGMKTHAVGNVVANDLVVSLESAVSMVHKYQVWVIATISTKEGETKDIDVTIMPKNTVVLNKKRAALTSLMRTFLKKHCPHDFSFECVYDCGSSLYGTNELLAGKTHVFELADIPEKHQPTLVKGKLLRVTFRFEHVKSLHLFNDGEKYSEENEREVAAFLDVLTSAQLLRNNDFNYVKGAYYHKSTRECMEVDIGQGIVVRKGFDKSIKVVQSSSGLREYSMNFTVRTKPFYKRSNLLDFLVARLGVRHPNDLSRILREDRSARDLLKNVVVSTTHLPVSMDFQIYNISKETARDSIIPELNQSVADYFMERYKISLKYPTLPMVIEKRGKRLSMHPIELLEVNPIQSVPVNKLRNQQAKVVEFTRLQPDQHVNDLHTLIPQAALGQSNAYLKAFGIRVEQKPREVQAVQVMRPALVYGDQTFDPMNDSSPNEMAWNSTFGEKFYKPANIPKTAVIVYKQAVRNQNDLQNVLRSLARGAQGHGMRGTENLERAEMISWGQMDDEQAVHEMQGLKRRGYNFVILVGALKKTDSEGHRMLKYAEQQAAVVTQHLACPTIGINSRPMGSQTVQNILLKMNQKLGGINYSVAVTPAMVQNSGTATALNEDFVGKLVMYVGLNVAHAGPQNFYDQAAGVELRVPSTVGMCYSTIAPTAYRGLYWFQAPREVLINDLKTNFIKAFEQFKSEVGQYPKKVVIFRGGVSEGEMDKAKEIECQGDDGISGALKALNIGCDVYSILVLIHNNMRLLRTEISPHGKPLENNLPPGAAITNGITDPRLIEAYITSQRGQIGTSRVTRLILIDQPDVAKKWTNDHLAWIGNAMGYCHGVSMCPTGIPAPLYSAMNLSKRAAEVRHNGNGVSDTMSMLSGSSREATEEQSKIYYERVCKENLVTLSGLHFWA